MPEQHQAASSQPVLLSPLPLNATAEELRGEIERLRGLLIDAGLAAMQTRKAHESRMAASEARTSSAYDEIATLKEDAVQSTLDHRELFDSEALRRAILESATEFAIISMDRAGRITSWNEGAVRIIGWLEAEVLGRPADVIFTEADRARGAPEREMEQAALTGRGSDERFHQRKDGSLFWANGLMMPLKAGEGRDIGFVKVLRDRSTEHAAQEALRLSEARLRQERNTLEAIFDAAPVGLSLAEAPSGASILLNSEMQRMLGDVDLSGPSTERYHRAGAFHPNGTPYTGDDYPSIRSLRQGVTIERQPVTFHRPDNTTLRAEISSTPIRDFGGDVIASITTVVDVEAREQANEHQQLLMGELSHRMKNTLSIVQAIVSQTLRSSHSLSQARGEIMERLAVLSRAQDALTRKSWMAALLSDTVDAALAPLGLGPDRLLVEGPEVLVGSRAALSFTLALHELGTNAVKYGALSSNEGRVEVRWREEGDRLSFTWNEQGGPTVEPPTRKGFGSRLIETVSRTFAGESALNYDPAGLCWKVTASLEALQTF